MASDTTAVLIMTALKAVEDTELTLINPITYGSDMPDVMPGTFPVIVRSLTRVLFYNEDTGSAKVVWMGPQDRTYHFTVSLVLGDSNKDRLSYQYSTVNTNMEYIPNAYLKWVSRSPNGVKRWQRLRVLSGRYVTRQYGDLITYGIDYDVQVLAIVNPTID